MIRTYAIYDRKRWVLIVLSITMAVSLLLLTLLTAADAHVVPVNYRDNRRRVRTPITKL